VQALATANPNDPALPATMVDPELVSARANLVGDQQKGIVGRGAVTLCEPSKRRRNAAVAARSHCRRSILERSQCLVAY
jgi:hypothetical protein